MIYYFFSIHQEEMKEKVFAMIQKIPFLVIKFSSMTTKVFSQRQRGFVFFVCCSWFRSG